MNANEALDKYLSSLDPKARIAKSRDIRCFCRVSTFILSNWRCGRTAIPWFLYGKITEAIGENIFKDITN